MTAEGLIPGGEEISTLPYPRGDIYYVFWVGKEMLTIVTLYWELSYYKMKKTVPVQNA